VVFRGIGRGAGIGRRWWIGRRVRRRRRPSEVAGGWDSSGEIVQGGFRQIAAVQLISGRREYMLCHV
jgi:hypothetical protein